MKKTPADKAREIVWMLEDCDADIDDFEYLQAHTTGDLLARVEDKLMKLDEEAEEKRQEDLIEQADAAYEWHMECKGDQMREDNAAFRRGE